MAISSRFLVLLLSIKDFCLQMNWLASILTLLILAIRVHSLFFINAIAPTRFRPGRWLNHFDF